MLKSIVNNRAMIAFAFLCFLIYGIFNMTIGMLFPLTFSGLYVYHFVNDLMKERKENERKFSNNG